MLVTGDLFNIILFVTAIGGILTVLSLLVNSVLRFQLPLWFGVCGMAAYVLPILAPGLRLVPPVAHAWVKGYETACTVWICGVVLFAGYDLARAILARRAIRSYRSCADGRILQICGQCVQLAGIKKMPTVYFGTLEHPACVVGALRPSVILNEEIIRQLTDKELLTVLCHEVTHIKRGHILLERIYDAVCVLNWFNPLVWVAKKEFAVHCEVDCDRHALAALRKQITNAEYADTMLRLLNLSMVRSGDPGYGMGALGFLLTKRRIALIMRRPSKAANMIWTAVLAALLAAMLLLSMRLSRGHFYPYPSYDTEPEYRCTEESFLCNKTTIVVIRRQYR